MEDDKPYQEVQGIQNRWNLSKKDERRHGMKLELISGGFVKEMTEECGH